MQRHRRDAPFGPAGSGKSTLANRFDIVSAAGHSRLVPSPLSQRCAHDPPEPPPVF